ncbi:RNA polymerase sigma factor [Psychroserpens mesophilus]|uniref:RNA polymerase sigma factor n=1 Tax=Psychroserpens mesophilus TaxID=325473 RepID=UPI003F494DE3
MEPLEKINKLSDEELVSNIVKNNDTLLFEVLYDRFAHLVYNKCYGFAKDEDEAKDLTQDVFLKLFVKLASFKGKSKFSTWLYAFTYNHCVNYVTRNTENISEEPNDEGFNEMRLDKLKQALELVSPDEKMILLLKYQDNLSIKEIESVLDIGESAVKMRIKRAKDKLLTVYSDNLV